MGVVPKEADTSPHQCGTENGQLARAAQKVDVQVLAGVDATDDVRGERKGQCCNRSESSGQAVQSIGDVDGVAGTRHHERDEQHVQPAEARSERDDEDVFVERKRRRCSGQVRQRMLPEVVPDSETKRDLSGEFIALDQRSEEHTSELQSHSDLVCRLLLEKKKKKTKIHKYTKDIRNS